MPANDHAPIDEIAASRSAGSAAAMALGERLIGDAQLWLRACRQAVAEAREGWLAPLCEPLAYPWPLDLLYEDHPARAVAGQNLAVCARAALSLRLACAGRLPADRLAADLVQAAARWQRAAIPSDNGLTGRIALAFQPGTPAAQQVEPLFAPMAAALPAWSLGPVQELISYYLGAEREGARSARVLVLLEQGPAGRVATMQLGLWPAGHDELYADPLRMAFCVLHEDFQQALRDAWEAARAGAGAGAAPAQVRWSLTGRPTARSRSAFLGQLRGVSIGVGCALGLLKLLDPGRAPPNERWATTGALGPGGTLRSVTGYGAKLEEAMLQRRSVIYPAADREVVAQGDWPARFAEARLRLIATATLAEVATLAAQAPLGIPLARVPMLTSFVGRAAEQAAYSAQLHAHGFAMITGLAGVGKTSLAATLALALYEPDRIFWHTIHRDEGVEVLIERLAGFLAYHGSAELWDALEQIRQTGGRAPHPSLALDAIAHGLRGRGFLVCLDNLHHMDRDSPLLHWIGGLQPDFEAGAIRMLAISRELPALGSGHSEPLRGLSQSDTAQLLAASPLAPLAARVHAVTEGNAQLVILARGALGGSNPQQILDQLTQHVNVKTFLMREIDEGLSQVERAVMRAAAIFAEEGATGEAIEAVAQTDGCYAALLRLQARHLISLRNDGAEELYVLHTIVQSHYYGQLGQRRQQLHRLAGTYYGDRAMLKAARHLQRAGEHRRAAELALADVWGSINRGQSRQLLKLLEELAEGQLAPRLWAEVLNTRGLLYSLIGEAAAAQASFQQALALMETMRSTRALRVQRARACRGLGELLQHESPQRALAWLQRGLGELAGADSIEQATLLIKAATVQITLGQHDAAEAAVQQGLRLLPGKPSQLRASALINLSLIACARGDVGAGNAHTQQALAISEQIHDTWSMLTIWLNMGVELEIAGGWAEAEEYYARAEEQAERIGSRKHALVLALNRGVLATNRGADDEAFAHFDRCIGRARAGNESLWLANALASLAELHIRRGEWAAATSALREADGLATTLGVGELQLEVGRAWAQLALAGDDPGGALERSGAAIDGARALSLDIAEAQGLRVAAQALGALARHDEARDALARSYTLLRGRDPYEAARTALLWVQALRGLDRDRAAGLLAEARASFAALGAARELKQAGALSDV